MNQLIRVKLLLPVALAILIAGCGGGGGGGNNNNPPAGSSNWDTMVWDQDNWG
ncbi:MAG: hypothetical protein BMS9Abin08_1048 [Gammaproteobacteria bacterium]|nr:MAG: hypothetical protein BMS9Abin08_1048 [Gammaproteobacteria bacterium]